MQLTNLLRDVGDDDREGRIYLLGDVMARHDVTPAVLLAWCGRLIESPATYTPERAAWVIVSVGGTFEHQPHQLIDRCRFCPLRARVLPNRGLSAVQPREMEVGWMYRENAAFRRGKPGWPFRNMKDYKGLGTRADFSASVCG